MKTNLTRFAAIASLIVALPAPLLAQSAPPAGRHSAQGMSVQDMMAKLRNKYGKLDTNHDNRISPTEWNTRKRSGKDHSRQFNKVDTNHDGYVSVAEINAFVQRKVTKADRNGDGFISPDERHHGGKGGKTARRGQPGNQAGGDDQY